MNSELLKGLSAEQIEKVKASNDPNELLKLAKEEGLELTAEQLGAISGGSCEAVDFGVELATEDPDLPKPPGKSPM